MSAQHPSDTALAEPPVRPLHQVASMDEYLQSYGKILGKKAVTSLAPLHVPGRDRLPDFDDLLRAPFDCQRHAITAAVGMLDEVGSGFLVGEMGTGKTLMGMAAILKHAQQSRRKGGHGGRFRCLVLCPDHLIGKWRREVEETVPDAKVVHFGPITEDEAAVRQATDPRGGQAYVLADLMRVIDSARHGHRWGKPDGPEYYILGRNQAKWYPDWLGTSDPYTGFGGRRVEQSVSARTIVVDRVPVLDADDRPVLDRKGDVVMQNVTARVFACPACGTVARDRKGLPLSAKDISKKKVACEGRYLRQLRNPDRKDQHGLDLICPLPKRYGEAKVGAEVTVGGHRYVVRECKEPLWWFTSRPYRWAPARIIQKTMRRFFQYLLIDECHEQKSDESAQSMACGKLISAADHTIALTGTIIGGYADHLFPLMMRIAPQSLRAEGFEWGKDLAFSEVYGRIDRIVTTKEEGATPEVGKSVKSMRRARSGKATERKAVRPGIMPTLFGRHMIGNSIFVTLDEMADELPDLHEYIGGPDPSGGDDPFWVDTACEMAPEQKAEYDRVEATLNFACKELLVRGSMKLLGTMLWTTLGWPDYCYAEWGRDDELAKAIRAAEAELREQAEREGKSAGPLRVPHTVGYWDRPGNKHLDNWMGVVTPRVLDGSVIYPKEDRLVDICLRHKAAGHQVWVYAQMTQKRNVTVRLQGILERHGLRVGVMRSDDVDPKEREDWIARHGRDFDVMICHPKLVSTGLDLFSKSQGGHNYNCIVFYQTGYNLFDMRQAARRSWRIGQPRDCYVYYLYYEGTMQHRAMGLMSKKMAAAHALEGEFSEDGLAAMAGEDNMQMALAKSLAAKIDDSDMQRSWAKIKSGEKKKVRRPTQAVAELARPPLAEPAPMPPIEKLIALTHAQRQAFKRLAAKPPGAYRPSEFKCIGETAEALVAAGLAEKVGDTYRCLLEAPTLGDVLLWFQLNHVDSRVHYPLGIVKARRPGGQDYYVRLTNHTATENIIEVHPVQGFPLVNSTPIWRNRARAEGWVLVQASDRDRAALRAQGFLVEEASPLDALPIEAQMAAAMILERQTKPTPAGSEADIDAFAEMLVQADAGMWATARSTAEGDDPETAETCTGVIAAQPEPEPVVLRVHRTEPNATPEPIPEILEDVEVPEFDEELLAKMFANLAAHGMTLEDLAG